MACQGWSRKKAQILDLNPVEHLWDATGALMCLRPPHTTLVPDLNNAPVAEWAQILTATLQNPKLLQKSEGNYKSK